MTPFHFDAETPSPTNAQHVIVPAGIETKSELLAFLQRALALPDYFGGNWDALEECLTDPDWLEDKALVLAHQDIPLEKTPAEQRTYLLILASIAMETDGELDIHFPEACRSRVTQLITGP